MSTPPIRPSAVPVCRAWPLLVVVLTLTACGGGGGGDQNLTHCGNGRLDAGERCDDGNVRDDDACTSVCQPARCGDGAIQAGVEECDGLNIGIGVTCDALGHGSAGGRTLPGCSAACRLDVSVCGPRKTPTPIVPTATTTPTPTATPTATPTPTLPTASCGNGLLQPGETCTSCPADCQPAACTADGTTVTYTVAVASGGVPREVRVQLAYRSSVLSLPGSGTDRSVAQRVRFAPPVPDANGFTVRDLDYAVEIASTRAAGLPLDPGPFATARFDVCGGAPDASLADVSCLVERCTGAAGPLDDCACIVRRQ